MRLGCNKNLLLLPCMHSLPLPHSYTPLPAIRSTYVRCSHEDACVPLSLPVAMRACHISHAPTPPTLTSSSLSCAPSCQQGAGRDAFLKNRWVADKREGGWERGRWVGEGQVGGRGAGGWERDRWVGEGRVGGGGAGGWERGRWVGEGRVGWGGAGGWVTLPVDGRHCLVYSQSVALDGARQTGGALLILAVHFSSRFNRKPHPDSALEKMMHTEWQRRKAHQPSLYDGSKFRYGGFSLSPSSAASPSAATTIEAPQGSEAAERGVQGSPRVCLHLGLTEYKSLITTNLCSDWQSFLAPPLSASAAAKRLKTGEGTGSRGTGGADGATVEEGGGEGASREESMEGNSWECGAGDGPQTSKMAQDGDATAAVASDAADPATATTSAAAVSGSTSATNSPTGVPHSHSSHECPHRKEEPSNHMAACATCQQAIGQRDAQACQHMGDALGNAALVVTADGCFLLLQRGTAVGEFPNCPVFPGGHPEPSEAGISTTPTSPPSQHSPANPQSSTIPSPHTSTASPPRSPSDSSSSPTLLNLTIAHEMFKGMKREVEEETGAPADSLHGMLFLGLCRRRENVRSLAMFLCHTSLTAPEVLSRYASAQHKFESTSLRAVPLAALLTEASSMPGCHMGGAVLAYCHLILHGHLPPT
ncbi:unnamed protein product [Closterium sp. Naga37s-1]|nr:unnamed protein product [Closterium sp. Naga37s-1]